MDRGYADRKVFSLLSEHEASFIIRGRRGRNLYYQGQELPFQDLVKSANLKHRYQSGKARLKAGMIRVGVRQDPFPRKNPKIIYLDLVIGCYTSTDTEGI